MTASDHATSHSQNTLRERGHPYMDFLGPGRIAAKTLTYRCWILLDFLGFPCQNLDLSMGYAGFSLEK
jgi:hypothetical protein